jgi:hypothetical protein
MNRQFDLDPRIINISQSFEFNGPEGSANAEHVLFGFGTRPGLDNLALFVVAAGASKNVAGGKRRGMQMDTVSSGCTVVPACWGNLPDFPPRALISVVALNGAGTDLLKEPDGNREPLTNYGLAFDVAAVGETVSFLHGDYLGRVKGSSFATPYVTGLAALIYGRAKAKLVRADRLTPLDLKNRILISADNPADLQKFSRFGRINFWKALSFETDWIRYRTSPTCTEQECWQSVKIERDNSRAILRLRSALREGLGPIPNELPFKLKDVLALRAEESGLFTVIVSEGSRLVRYLNADVDLSIQGGSPNVVQRDDGRFPFVLSDMVEYVACSFAGSCPK